MNIRQKHTIRRHVPLLFVFFLFALIVIPLTVSLSQQSQDIRQNAAASVLPHVVGNKIIDGSGNQLILRGAQIPSELNSTWHGGASAKLVLNPTVFAEMHAWGMNTLRLPVGAYLYQQSGYMTFLDQVVQQANAAGLYVILASFETGSAGGGSGVLDQQGLVFWQSMGQHFANNPLVIYDLINEPQNSSYTEWLNGGGNVVGMQQVVNAIRAAGGKQIIVAEAINTNTTYFQGFTSFINDPNIIYSNHMYFKNTAERSTSGWDSEFGNMSANYPMFIGEWALLPNARYPSFCSGLDATSGTQLVNSFLTYMEQHQVSWTAWEFKTSHMFKDASFTPTVLTDPWCCGQGPVCGAGMGSIIKSYLLKGGVSTTPPLTPTITPTRTPTITSTLTLPPSITPTVVPTQTPNPHATNLVITVCPHGLSTCGDNTNPQSGGNLTPAHTQRVITITILNSTNQIATTQQGQLTFTNGTFTNIVSFPTLQSGVYRVKLHMDGYLTKLVPGAQTITAQQTSTLPVVSLVNGDINTDNQLDILDYSLLIGCYGSKAGTGSCVNKSASDINDDGIVDGIDLNVFLRELSVQHGD